MNPKTEHHASRRTLHALGVRSGTALQRAVNATIRALKSDPLPGAGDYETAFAFGRDDVHVSVLTARNQPPIPLDD